MGPSQTGSVTYLVQVGMTSSRMTSSRMTSSKRFLLASGVSVRVKDAASHLGTRYRRPSISISPYFYSSPSDLHPSPTPPNASSSSLIPDSHLTEPDPNEPNFFKFSELKQMHIVLTQIQAHFSTSPKSTSCSQSSTLPHQLSKPFWTSCCHDQCVLGVSLKLPRLTV